MKQRSFFLCWSCLKLSSYRFWGRKSCWQVFCELWLSWLSPPVSRCRRGWAGAVGGYVDRDSSWLHGECLGPCVYRERLTASPEQGAYCLWEMETFLSSPMSIFWGLIWSKLVLYLPEWPFIFPSWRGDMWITDIPVSSATWCSLYSNWGDVHVVIFWKLLFLSALGTCYDVQDLLQHGGVTDTATWSKPTSFHVKEFDMKYWNKTAL